MKKRKYCLALLLPFALVLFLGACSKTQQTQLVTKAKSWDLAVVKVAATEIPVEYTTVGSVVSDQRIEVTSRMSGYIHELLVREGDRIRRGQIIARLDGAGTANAEFTDAQIDFERFQRF